MKHTLTFLAIAASLTACSSLKSEPSTYDPLRVTSTSGVQTLRLTVHDASRNRDLPIRVYLPAATKPAPVVLFSHGLGGSCENNPYLGNHWAARGYVAVFMQHPGSDESVWKDQPAKDRMAAMSKAASLENLKLRLTDVPAVIDQLDKWRKQSGHTLSGRLDMKRIGMSGHSFGAVTTQAVSGQKFPMGLMSPIDSRIKAAVAFSPSAPKVGRADRAFGDVNIPWLLMTGTNDTSPINNTDVASRLAVFPALPKGGKYELVLDGAEHSAFGDRALPGDRETRNPNHHRAILALSTAFWDAWLRDDAKARAWLDGKGPLSVLEENDRWQTK